MTTHVQSQLLYFAALLLGILACMPADHVAAQFQITAQTPQQVLGVDYGIFVTGISIVASSLLDSNTAGLLWGSIPSDTVNSICDQITANGSYDFSASVTYDTGTFARNMQIQSVGGCGASDSAPDGVEALLSDDDGRLSALVCPPYSSNSGCYLYDTGDDVQNGYNSIVNGQAPALGGGGRRKLLDSCSNQGEGGGIGALVGFFIGQALVMFLCPAEEVAVPIAGSVICAATLSVFGAGAGAGAGIGIACHPQSACFPGNALVTTSNDVTLPISQISLGDKVAVRKPHGAIAYSPVYAFGHADPNASTIFIKLTLSTDTSSIRTLTLTPDHLAPIILRDSKKVSYKRAKNIRIGDIMLIANDDMKETFTSNVTDVLLTIEDGLYNPFTIEKNIIVDGVVASVHSYWFLDDWFDNLGIPLHVLHEAYQVIMLPVMTLRRVLGEKMYHDLYLNIDASFGIATMGTLYGGHIAIFTTITTIISGLLCLRYATKNLTN